MGQSTTARWVKLVALAALVALPAAVALSYLLAWFNTPIIPEGSGGAANLGGPVNTPFIWPGLRLPAAVKAHDAALADNEAVIGVAVAGRQRAYRVKAMNTINTRVINDLLGQVPATVTYDDRNDRAQVFTSDKVGRPLEVETGGYYDGLLLRIDGRFFLQATGRKLTAPGAEGEQVLSTMPHSRTAWKDWRAAYPETDVFVGLNLPAGAP